MALYSYPMLECERDIRVLRLRPTTIPESPLEGDLVVKNLDDCPTYDALSYTWDPPFSEEVLTEDEICDGDLRIPITGNLNCALRKLRDPYNIRALWIDAVCIDQSNTDERNRQVRMMHCIYLQADHVIAWLGPDSDLRDGAFLLTLGRAMMHQSGTRALKPGSEDATKVIRTHCASCAAANPKNLLSIFLRRRYFTRRWILQELYFGYSVMIVCGDHTVDWIGFQAALTGILLHFDILEAWPPLLNLQARRDDPRSTGIIPDTLSTLCLFRDLQCADARDRIFSLIHLWRGHVVHVDYSEPYDALCQSLARQLISRDEALVGRNPSIRMANISTIILLAAYQAGQRDVLESTSLGLEGASDATPERIAAPTWVPDWTLRLPERLQFPVYEAQRAHAAAIGPQGALLIDGNICIYGEIWPALPVQRNAWFPEQVQNPRTSIRYCQTASNKRVHALANVGMRLRSLLIDHRQAKDCSSNDEELWVSLHNSCPDLKMGDLVGWPSARDKKFGYAMATVYRKIGSAHQGTFEVRIIGQLPLEIFGINPDMHVSGDRLSRLLASEYAIKVVDIPGSYGMKVSIV